MALAFASGGGGGGQSVTYAFTDGNAGGNFTTTSATFVDMGLAVSIAAVSGDVLVVSFHGNCDSTLSGTQNFVGVVATTSGTQIRNANVDNANAGAFTSIDLRVFYTVAAGDLAGGNIALKMRFASGGGTFAISNTVASSAPQVNVLNLRH